MRKKIVLNNGLVFDVFGEGYASDSNIEGVVHEVPVFICEVEPLYKGGQPRYMKFPKYMVDSVRDENGDWFDRRKQ